MTDKQWTANQLKRRTYGKIGQRNYGAERTEPNSSVYVDIVLEEAKKYLFENPTEASVLRNMEKFSAKDIFDAAKEKDEVALRMTEDVGNMLGKALAMIACVVNPEAFVIGGGMSKAGDILLDSIRRHYCKYAFHASQDTEFRMAKLSNDAGMYGGVRMILS